MTVVRELATLLTFKTDRSGANEAEQGLTKLRVLAVAAAAAVAAAGAAILGTIAKAGDEMTGNLNKLEGSLGSATKASEVYDKLYNVVRQTGAGLSDTTTAFNNYNLAMSKNGKSTDDTIGLIGGLQAAMSSLGLSTAQVSSVTLQLGQALGKGVLNGDELVSLREAMPQLVDELRKSLNMTDAQFSKAAEKGELTAEKLIGPLLKYSDQAFKKLLALPPLMSRSTAILSTTWQRFNADLDKTLGLSQWIARGLNGISDRLEAFRNSLPALAAFIARLGGIRQIMEVVGYAVGIGTAALIAFNAQLALTVVRTLAAYAAIALPWVLLAGVIAIAAALVQDFVSYVQGNTAGSLFGSWFGDFQTLIQPVRDGIARVQEAFAGLGVSVDAAIEKMRPQVEWLVFAVGTMWAGAARLVMAAWEPVSAFFVRFWDALTQGFREGWAVISPIVEAISGAARFLGGALGGSGAIQPGEERAPRRGSIRGGAALGGFGSAPAGEAETSPGEATPAGRASVMPGVERLNIQPPGAELAGRIGAAANSNTVTQTVNLGGVTVTPSGGSPAETAAAARRGAGQALQSGMAAFDENALARRIGNGIPATEAR